jgi:hypothetical protein
VEGGRGSHVPAPHVVAKVCFADGCWRGHWAALKWVYRLRKYPINQAGRRRQWLICPNQRLSLSPRASGRWLGSFSIHRVQNDRGIVAAQTYDQQYAASNKDGNAPAESVSVLPATSLCRRGALPGWVLGEQYDARDTTDHYSSQSYPERKCASHMEIKQRETPAITPEPKHWITQKTQQT